MATKLTNARKDKKVFKSTARRVHKSNYLVPRGGMRK